MFVAMLTNGIPPTAEMFFEGEGECGKKYKEDSKTPLSGSTQCRAKPMEDRHRLLY